MFKLNLTLRKKNDDIMIFSPAPWFRILFLAIAVFIVIGITAAASDENNDGSFTVPIVITLICIIGALYEECWIFDRKEKTISSRTGLLFISRKKNWTFEDVSKLEFAVFIRGGRTVKADMQDSDTETAASVNTQKKNIKRYCQAIRLNLKSGDSIEIETAEGYNTDILKQKAWILSDFCGFELSQ